MGLRPATERSAIRENGGTEKPRAGQVVLADVRITARRCRLLALGVAALSATIVFHTWFFFQIYETPGAFDRGSEVPRWVLAHLNLCRENVVATWISSTLMLLVAVLAVACFLADRARRRSRLDSRLGFGWLVVAAVFAIFSMDELISLHENVGTPQDANPFGSAGLSWRGVLTLVIGAIVLLMVPFTLLHLLRGSRLAFVLLVVGAGLLFTVPFQERTGAVREETTELVAIVFFLSALLTYLHARAGGRLRVVVSRDALLAAALVAVAVLATAFWAFEHPLEGAPGDLGMPRDWFLSTPGVLTALVGVTLAAQAPPGLRGRRGAYLAAAGLGALLAVYFGANIQGYLSIGNVGDWIRKGANAAIILWGAALAVVLPQLVRSWWSRAASVAAAVLLGIALRNLQSFGGEYEFAAVSVLLLSLIGHLPEAGVTERLREERARARPPAPAREGVAAR
jgi:hypothetical protein